MEAINLAVMSFDGIHLLLPQLSVATIEVADSLSDEVDITGSIGSLNSGAQKWPVFALTSDFKLRSDRPGTYKFCVAINHNDKESFAIVCEEVGTLPIENASNLKPLKTCMRIPTCPIDSLMLKDNKLMLVGNVETMQQYLISETVEV